LALLKVEANGRPLSQWHKIKVKIGFRSASWTTVSQGLEGIQRALLSANATQNVGGNLMSEIFSLLSIQA
jgi:hypothetical protein